MASASVTIDAGVLAVPLEDGTAEDAYRYVDTLLDWSRLLDESWVSIYMSEWASQALCDDGLYPLRDQLMRLFTANGIVEYDVNTVAMVVDQLLRLTPSFETYFSIRDVLAEELTIEPDILRFCSGSRLQSDLARCVVLIAILRRYCQEPIRDHSLILRRVPDRSIRVRALIYELEHQRDDLRSLPTPPEYFKGDVLVCDNFRGFVECLDEAAILRKSNDDIGVETAIRIAVYKSRLERGAAPEWDDVPNYRIGHAFRSSLHRVNLTQQLASKLLRAIVETLEQSNMAATHWLRTGPGGNDPQRLRGRDGAKAWRRDIDRDYHLHYWACDDGFVEFASVSFPHDDFEIPD
jgi:hypothetical protein